MAIFDFLRPKSNISKRGVVGISTSGWNLLAGEGYIPMTESPEVRMCVHAYADLISDMTIHLMENTEGGDRRIHDELARKIDVQPNPLMNRKQFIYNIVNVLLTSGDGNCVVIPEHKGEILTNLVPVAPSRVSFEARGDGYVIKVDDKIEYKPDEVLHFAINPDPEQPWKGRGYSVTVKEAVRAIATANKVKKNLMSSPAPSLIVKVDGLVDEFASPEGREKLISKYVDVSQSGKPWVIPADLIEVSQVKPLTMSDLAVSQNVELDRRTIAAIFNVPAFCVGVGNYNDDEWQKFINTGVMSLAMYIQQELTAKLLFSPKRYFRFNPRSLFNYKLKDLIDAGAEMVDRMAMRRNEWRDWLGLEPDEEMTELLALENYIPADRLGDQKKLVGKDE